MWDAIDDWPSALPADTFTAVLPLLRRTFSTFEAPPRSGTGEQARRGPTRGVARSGGGESMTADDISAARAEALPLSCHILGTRIGSGPTRE